MLNPRCGFISAVLRKVMNYKFHRHDWIGTLPELYTATPQLFCQKTLNITRKSFLSLPRACSYCGRFSDRWMVANSHHGLSKLSSRFPSFLGCIHADWLRVMMLQHFFYFYHLLFFGWYVMLSNNKLISDGKRKTVRSISSVSRILLTGRQGTRFYVSESRQLR